ncbi:MAG: hypothetical protein OHK0024_30100 [Thalassobaculales bacterium]
MDTEEAMQGLVRLHGEIEGKATLAEQFLAYFSLLEAAGELDSELRIRTAKQRKHLDDLTETHRFYNRHQTKLEALRRALAGTYTNPDRAFDKLDELMSGLSRDAIIKILAFGPHPLGKAHGFGFLGFRDSRRQRAEDNYVEIILPAMTAIADDHVAYKKVGKTDWNKLLGEAQSRLATLESQRSMLDAMIAEWKLTQMSVAKAMKAADMEGLDIVKRRLASTMQKMDAGQIKG